jgi:GntR family transcriptional regulator/MocR family aminotransferase
MADELAAPAASGLDLHLDLAGSAGKRAAVMGALREAIRGGRLAPGTRLPSTRSLATDLGVARNTVAEAYAELTAEGWLVARQGSGTRVAPGAAPLAGPAVLPAAPPRKRPRHRYDLKPGQPDAAAFPRAAWLRSARRALAAAPSEAFGPGDPQGRRELREALAGYLARARGVRTEPGRIVITAGFSHALSILAQVVPGPVAVEAYGLPPHRRLLTAAGLHTVALPVDEHGARLGTLATARTALLTPAHQFPTGGWLRPERRAAVIDWARTTGGLVLEDDYDGEFRHDRQPVGALQVLDPERVVFLGTVSKSLTPALRLGWMALPGHLVGPVLKLKGERELRVSVLDQLTLADFVASGAYDQHVRRMRQRYRRRRDRLRAALAERVPEVGVPGIAAGLHAVLELPEGTEAAVLGASARRGIAVTGLSSYRHPDAPVPGRDGLVVGFGTPPDHAFGLALRALCEVLREGLRDRSASPVRHREVHGRSAAGRWEVA